MLKKIWTISEHQTNHETMKPTRRIQTQKQSSLQEKVVEVGSKSAAVGQTKTASHGSKPSQTKAFAGKVFYLDLPSNKKAEVLENDIKQLGGIVEKFFSKEIKYLVSSKREAKYVHCLRRDLSFSGPDSGHSSPLPRRPSPQQAANQRDTQGQSDAVVTSRGRALVEKVVKKEQERIQMNKILTNALEWGVKILYIDDVLTYVEKKKKNQSTVSTAVVQKVVKVQSSARPAFQRCKGGRIARPFVKVEDSSRHYRPIYLSMSTLPELNLKTLPPCTPFCPQDKKPREHGAESSEERGQARARRNRDKKKAGYCECCLLKYDNLAMHLQGERHKAFSTSDDEYLVLDRLVSTLDCNFRTTTPTHTKTSRSKVGESSILLLPGAHVKAESQADPADGTEGRCSLRDTQAGLSTAKHKSVPVRHSDPKNSELISRTTTLIHTKTSRSKGRVPDVLLVPGPESQHDPADSKEGRSSHRPTEGELSTAKHNSVPVSHGDADPKNPDNASNTLYLKHRLAPRKRPRRYDRPSTPAPGVPQNRPRPQAETSPSRVERLTADLAVLTGFPESDSQCHRTKSTDEKGSNPGGDHHTGNAPYRVPSNSPILVLSTCDAPVSARERVADTQVLSGDAAGASQREAGGECPSQSRTPGRRLQRKVRSYKRKRRKVESPWTIGERMRTRTSPEGSLDIPESILTLWHLFQSSEDTDPEFLGFDD